MWAGLPDQHTRYRHGMNIACRNARRLADDAKLLLDAGRYPGQLSGLERQIELLAVDFREIAVD